MKFSNVLVASLMTGSAFGLFRRTPAPEPAALPAELELEKRHDHSPDGCVAYVTVTVTMEGCAYASGEKPRLLTRYSTSRDHHQYCNRDQRNHCVFFSFRSTTSIINDNLGSSCTSSAQRSSIKRSSFQRCCSSTRESPFGCTIKRPGYQCRSFKRCTSQILRTSFIRRNLQWQHCHQRQQVGHDLHSISIGWWLQVCRRSQQ
jgi:hypothetical protein